MNFGRKRLTARISANGLQRAYGGGGTYDPIIKTAMAPQLSAYSSHHPRTDFIEEFLF
jgi:hypothetical protein